MADPVATPQTPMPTPADGVGIQPNTAAKPITGPNLHYIIAFIIPIITGIIVFLVDPDKRVKSYAVQSVLLGIMIIVIAIIGSVIQSVLIASSAPVGTPYLYVYNPAAFGTAYLVGNVFELINLVLWLFGLYVGYMAYTGKDVAIPVITDMAKRFAV